MGLLLFRATSGQRCSIAAMHAAVGCWPLASSIPDGLCSPLIDC